MKEIEITVNGKVFKMKELKYKDVTSFGELSKEESDKQLMLLYTKLTDEEYANLTMSDSVK